MHVRDLEGNEYPAQLTRTWDGELNGSQSLSATILPSKVNLQFINDISEMWVIVDDDVEYKIVYCKRQGDGNRMRANIKAIPLFFDDFRSQRIYERYDQHMTANAFFSLVFEGSGYGFIINGNFEAIQWEGLGEGDTRMNMFKEGLNRYKAEFRIVGKTIYLENLIGNDTQFRYEHRLNASNIVQEIDANDFYTYAKGYGDYGDGQGGEDWQNAKLIREYTSPLANIPAIGKREAPPIMNGNITTRATMDEQLKILVDESLKISVSANIHDLTRQGYPIAQANLGDRVFLIDRRIGFEEEIRVVAMSITRNWKDEIINMSITFGVPGLAKRYQSNLSSATKSITQLLEGNLQLPFSVVDDRIKSMTYALQNVLTELSVPPNGGLMAVDKDNPNNLVLFNAAGVGISDDGGATFRTAMTGEGFNADVITTGTMLADRIAGGILQSLNNNFELNMNTGEMYSENVAWSLGGGAQINFLSSNNKIQYRLYDDEDRFSRVSGFGVGTALGGRYPFAHMGTTGAAEMDTLSRFYSGFIANTTARIAEGEANSINGKRLQLRDEAVGWTKGVTFDFTGNSPTIDMIGGSTFDYSIGELKKILGRQDFEVRNYFNNSSGWLMETNYSGSGAGITLRGLNGGDFNYNIGGQESYNWITHTWTRNLTSEYVNADYVNGTVVGTSTVNAKMEIEDVDSQQAFDYFMMMVIKSFYYKNSDYTNRFNRKVSPIIEQLDPVLENLYKATNDGLDINSNLFLLGLAFQHHVNETNERLEVLENGAN